MTTIRVNKKQGVEVHRRRAASTVPTPAEGVTAQFRDTDGVYKVKDSKNKVQTLLEYNGAKGMTYQEPDAIAVTGGTIEGVSSLRSKGPIGYEGGAGIGGTVTQTTNKTTSVTLNALTGSITTSAAALAGDSTAGFVLNNSFLEAEDQLIVTHHSGGTSGSYSLTGRATGAGTGAIAIRNVTTGSLSQAIVIKFTIKKAVIT